LFEQFRIKHVNSLPSEYAEKSARMFVTSRYWPILGG